MLSKFEVALPHSQAGRRVREGGGVFSGGCEPDCDFQIGNAPEFTVARVTDQKAIEQLLARGADDEVFEDESNFAQRHYALQKVDCTDAA
jgi:hypothetical protein